MKTKKKKVGHTRFTKAKANLRRRLASGKRAVPRKSNNVVSLRDRLNAKQGVALSYFLANPTVRTPVERHVDERGEFVTIENVASFRNPIGSVAVLTRKAGSVFAEHKHGREGHTVYVASGRVKYREQRPDKLVDLVLAPGGAVFSPPNVPHAFLAMEDSTCVVVANISRTQEEYEADVQRLAPEKKLFSAHDLTLYVLNSLGTAPLSVEEIKGSPDGRPGHDDVSGEPV